MGEGLPWWVIPTAVVVVVFLSTLFQSRAVPPPRRRFDYRRALEESGGPRRLREVTPQQRAEADRQTFGRDLWGVGEAQRKAPLRKDRLDKLGLPVLAHETDLAAWLGIPLSRLRWYTWDRAADTHWHYTRQVVPKRRGGQRVLLAPKRQLKALQRKVLDGILAKVPVHDAAHGFLPDRSIRTNAEPHVGHAFVLNMDLQEFFPSVTWHRVRGIFIALGYPFAVASALALLCTERDRVPYKRDDATWWVGLTPRALVQGAPTSPALSNIVARRLDRRLRGLARKHDFTYTRYADDLTFSGNSLDHALRIMDATHGIVKAENFAINEGKTRIFRRSSRQVVTGVVVNRQTSSVRRLRRTLRAILHNASKSSLEEQNRDKHPHFRAYLDGLIRFVGQLHAPHAVPLRQALDELSSQKSS